MIYHCDIEADGLLGELTKIHCLSLKEHGGKILTCIKDIHKVFSAHFQDGDTLVFHNGFGYDFPALMKLGIIKDYSVLPDSITLMDGTVKNVQLIDTLAMSRSFYPDLPGGHSLAAYAQRLNGVKPVVEDWKDQPIEVYIERCEADVILTEQVFKYLCGKLEVEL